MSVLKYEMNIFCLFPPYYGSKFDFSMGHLVCLQIQILHFILAQGSCYNLNLCSSRTFHMPGIEHQLPNTHTCIAGYYDLFSIFIKMWSFNILLVRYDRSWAPG